MHLTYAAKYFPATEGAEARSLTYVQLDMQSFSKYVQVPKALQINAFHAYYGTGAAPSGGFRGHYR